MPAPGDQASGMQGNGAAGCLTGAMHDRSSSFLLVTAWTWPDAFSSGWTDAAHAQGMLLSTLAKRPVLHRQNCRNSRKAHITSAVEPQASSSQPADASRVRFGNRIRQSSWDAKEAGGGRGEGADYLYELGASSSVNLNIDTGAYALRAAATAALLREAHKHTTQAAFRVFVAPLDDGINRRTLACELHSSVAPHPLPNTMSALATRSPDQRPPGLAVHRNRELQVCARASERHRGREPAEMGLQDL
jgi:hypothetical protein